MTEAKEVQIADIGFPPVGAQLGSAFLKEAEQWIGAQGEILTNMEALMTGWARRQREALDSSTRSIQRMYECRNLMDLFQIQQQFLTDCLQWTASEMRALGSDAATVTRTAAARFGDVASRQAETARRPERASRESLEKKPVQQRAAAE